MAKVAFILLICLTLHSALSYYGPPPYPTRVVYRHHIAPPYQPQYQPQYQQQYQQQYQPQYQPQASFMSPVPPQLPVHYPPPVAYGPPPPPPPAPIHMGAARPVPYFSPPPLPPPHPMHHHHHYAPSASHQQNLYSNSHMAPPPSPSRYPVRNMFGSPFGGAFSQQPPKPSIFTKIKPYLFGGTGPRSLPHHPYYPNMYHPHQFSPNRPFQNRPAAHHAFPVHAPPPPMHAPSPVVMKPQKSCSCSLHVGQLTVYKHTDMRSSYSCQDLKDCNSFCTNLFSSEDLRAQTRADACLILGKDTKVPWFRRDHVCEPHGVKNDTKLSVDLCCKNLQPC